MPEHKLKPIYSTFLTVLFAILVLAVHLMNKKKRSKLFFTLETCNLAGVKSKEMEDCASTKSLCRALCFMSIMKSNHQ